MLHRPISPRARAHAHEVLRRLDLFGKRDQLASALTLAGSQAARSRARACDRSEASAARRGDGGAAAGRDRPHGGDPHHAQSRDRTDHPPHRARHARGDGAGRARAGAPPRRGDRAKARRTPWCASRRWSNPISARRRSTDAARRAPRCLSWRRPGARRRVARDRRGDDRRHRRRQWRRQDLPHSHHRRHASARARAHRVPRHRYRRLGEPSRLQSRDRPGGGRPAGVSDALGRGEPRHGRDGAARPRRRGRKIWSGYWRCFPCSPSARGRRRARCQEASSRCWRSAAA